MEKKLMTLVMLATLIVSIIGLTSVAKFIVVAPELPWLEVKPSSYITSSMEVFSISVWLNGITKDKRMVGFQFRLCYNSTLLEVLDVTEGPFLPAFNNTKTPPYTLFTYYIEPDSAYGPHVIVGGVILPETGPWTVFPEGSGEIARITFRGIYPKGSCTLELKPVFDIWLLDDKNEPILTAAPINGYYEIFFEVLYLDAEPARLIDLRYPLSTQWHELFPGYSRRYRVESWHDTDRNSMLNPSDYIGLWDKDLDLEAKPYWWHIDDVTVTMKVTKKPYMEETMYIEFEGGWTFYDRVIIVPTNTQWHEVYPVYSEHYNLEEWFDNCDSKLSPCDQIILRDKRTGEQAEYHVDEVSTNLIITPRVTQIIVGKTKDCVGQGHNQTIYITIKNYNPYATTFGVYAYHDGLPIGNKTKTLNPIDYAIIVIPWNTTTWLKGTYSFDITIEVYADSTLVYAATFPITFKITIEGDINGDGKVNIDDIATAAKAFGSYRNHPRYNPNADINCNGIIDIRDITIIAKNFGKIDP